MMQGTAPFMARGKVLFRARGKVPFIARGNVLFMALSKMPFIALGKVWHFLYVLRKTYSGHNSFSLVYKFHLGTWIST